MVETAFLGDEILQELVFNIQFLDFEVAYFKIAFVRREQTHTFPGPIRIGKKRRGFDRQVLVSHTQKGVH